MVVPFAGCVDSAGAVAGLRHARSAEEGNAGCEPEKAKESSAAEARSPCSGNYVVRRGVADITGRCQLSTN